VVIVAPATAIANAIEMAARTKRGATGHSVQFIALLSYLGRVVSASMVGKAHLVQDRARSGAVESGAKSNMFFVMAGLDPAIRVLLAELPKRRGSPGQARR
jgi:hypothetical protein